MDTPLDTELESLPPELRWREWMSRVEAVLFAAAGPVGRADLARIVGTGCTLELLIEDISNDLADRPVEIARSGGGWMLRTRSRHAAAIRSALGPADSTRPLTRGEALVLTVIAYLQPVTRGRISALAGREVSRDVIGRLQRQGLIGRGPRSPEPGAPYTYVTTPGFLQQFGLETLRELPDLEALQDAGLLAEDAAPPFDLPFAGRDID